MVSLSMLGSTSLTKVDGAEVLSVLAQPKRLALLVCLALKTPGEFQRRETLVGLLWPEKDQKSARASLSVALHHLRRSLGPDVVVTRGQEEIGVDHERLSVDVHEMQRALAEDDLLRVAELYTGTLLEGFYLDGSSEFMRLLDNKRDELRRSAVEALGRLVDEAEAAGDDAARVWARRAVDLAPYDSVAVRRLITLLARSGHRGNALKVYEDFAVRLGEDLEMEPSEVMLTLVQQVRDGELGSLRRGGSTAGPLPTVSVESPAPPAPAASLNEPRSSQSRASSSRKRSAFTLSGWMAAGALLVFGTPFADRLTPTADNAQDGGSALLPDDAKRRVLLLPPANLSSEPEFDPWSVLALDALHRAFDQYTELDVVPASSTRDLLAAAGDSQRATPSLLQRSGATHALASSYVQVNGTLSMNLEMVEGTSGEVLRSIGPVQLDVDRVIESMRELEDVAAAAAIYFEAHDGWPLRLNSLPRTPEPARLIIQARDAFCAFRQEDAVRLAERARTLEPTWPAPYMLLRPALFNLGRAAEWEDVYEEPLLGLVPRMSAFERSNWEFMEGATTEDRLRGAVTGFRLTGSEGPFNQGYAVAFRALQLNYLDLAREGLEALRGMEGPCSVGWVYRWVVDSQLYHLTGEYELELRRLEDGRERFPQDHMLLRDETVALALTGNLSDLSSKLDDIEALPVPPDSTWNALHDIAMEMRVHGLEAEAGETAIRLVEWAESRELSTLHLGHALYDDRQYAAAEPLLRSAAADSATGASYGLLSMTLHQLGRREEAESYVRALESGEALVHYGDHAPEEYPALRWPAIVAASRGELDRAVTLLQRAFDQGLRYYDLNQMQIHIRPELEALRTHPGFQRLYQPRPYAEPPIS